MKNRSCPDKIACWDYDANNCEDCAVGNLILRQKKSIKRLKSELEKYKRALSKVIKDRNVLAKDFYGTILQGEGQLYEDYYLGWVEHEMQEERK